MKLKTIRVKPPEFPVIAATFTDSLTDSASAEEDSSRSWCGFLSSGLNIGGKIGAILCARVGGMDAERVERAARMLPDTAPLIPVEAQSPKQTGQTGFSGG